MRPILQRALSSRSQLMSHIWKWVMLVSLPLSCWLELGVCVEIPVKTVWTVYTNEKTWSEADLLCQMTGGHLASVNTTHRVDVYEHFMAKEPWKSLVNYGATVGLHNLADKNADPRYWAADCSQTSVQFTFTASTVGEGGCASMAASKMYTVPCDYRNEFVCETGGGPCNYIIYTGKTASSGVTSTTVTTSNDAECIASCDALGTDCWAAARHGITGECRLYQTSTFYFDGGANMVSDNDFTMFAKSCYEARVVNDAMDWMTFDSVTPSSPCANSSEGRVYTLVPWNFTAPEAKAYCSFIGQRLAGVTTQEDLVTIQQVITDFYEMTYRVSSWSPMWVDFNGNQSGAPTWSGGSQVTGGVTVQGHAGSQCGLLDTTTGQHVLDDCHEQHAFMCVKNNVPCVYVKKERMHGSDYTPANDGLSRDECQELCDAKRNNGEPCFAFSYRPGAFFTSSKCYHHLGSLANSTTFFPDWSSNSNFDLYRWTCSYVVLQMDLLVDQVTSPPPATTSASPDPEPTTSETLIMQETRDWHTADSSSTVSSVDTEQTTDEETTLVQQTTTSQTAADVTDSVSTTKTILQVTSTDQQPVTHQQTTLAADATSISVDPATSEQTPSVSPKASVSLMTTNIDSNTDSTIISTDETGVTAMMTSRADDVTLSPAPTTASPQRLCECRCNVHSPLPNVSDDVIQTLQQELHVDKASTYKTRMRYVSAYDGRTSARSIGAVAIAFVSAVVGLIVFLDFSG